MTLIKKLAGLLFLGGILALTTLPVAAMPTDTAEAYKASDAELNALYTKIVGTLEKPQKDALKKAQRAWIAYRDAEADMRAGVTSEGGSAYTVDLIENLETLTLERIKTLKRIYHIGKSDG